MEPKKQFKKEREKAKSLDRAKQTLYRTLSKNNYQLQQMIDRKSNILISINALIVSVLIGMIYLRDYMLIETFVPPVVLCASCFLSIFFALLAVKPFHITEASLGWNSKNLLNYEAIRNLNIEDYKLRIKNVSNNEDSIYDAITEDVYFIGQNIKTKHRHLSISAGIFVIGLGISMLLFFIITI